MRRKFLLSSVLFMLIVGVILISFPFTQSLAPSQKAKAARSQHDISTLKSGEYRFDNFGRENSWTQKVLLLKTLTGKLFVYVFPANENGIPLPRHWWGFGHNMHICKDFRPTISKDANIKCHDLDTPDWGEDTWVWDLSGKSHAFWIADLIAPNIEINNQTVYINL